VARSELADQRAEFANAQKPDLFWELKEPLSTRPRS